MFTYTSGLWGRMFTKTMNLGQSVWGDDRYLTLYWNDTLNKKYPYWGTRKRGRNTLFNLLVHTWLLQTKEGLRSTLHRNYLVYRCLLETKSLSNSSLLCKKFLCLVRLKYVWVPRIVDVFVERVQLEVNQCLLFFRSFERLLFFIR